MTRKSLVVVTAAVGDSFSEMGSVTHPLMRAYAQRCGADFRVFTAPLVGSETGLPGRYEKFQLFSLLDDYDRLLFLDSDILVSPVAPDLFRLVPEGKFGMANEETFSRAPLDRQLTQTVLGAINWGSPYFNSGLMLVDRAHADFFDPRSPLLERWHAFCKGESRYHPAGEDQAYLNYRLASSTLPFVDLGHQFNFTGVRSDPERRFNSYFLHYSGRGGFRYGPRLVQMRKDKRVLLNPVAFKLARSSPRIRWLLDRLDRHFLMYLYHRYALGNRAA